MKLVALNVLKLQNRKKLILIIILILIIMINKNNKLQIFKINLIKFYYKLNNNNIINNMQLMQ